MITTIVILFIVFLVWYHFSVSRPIKRQMLQQQRLVEKRRKMDEDAFYVSLKASIDQATNQQDLYRAYIDLIIFKHNYHGYHARIYKAKLEEFYNKKLTELKAIVLD